MSMEIHSLHSKLQSLSKNMNLMYKKVAITANTCSYYLILTTYKNLMVWKVNGNFKFLSMPMLRVLFFLSQFSPLLMLYSSPTLVFGTSKQECLSLENALEFVMSPHSLEETPNIGIISATLQLEPTP